MCLVQEALLLGNGTHATFNSLQLESGTYQQWVHSFIALFIVNISLVKSWKQNEKRAARKCQNAHHQKRAVWVTPPSPSRLRTISRRRRCTRMGVWLGRRWCPWNVAFPSPTTTTRFLMSRSTSKLNKSRKTVFTANYCQMSTSRVNHLINHDSIHWS